MQESAFTILCLLNCYDYYIYKDDCKKDISVYNTNKITTRQSIYYFDSKDLEKQERLVEYY